MILSVWSTDLVVRPDSVELVPLMSLRTNPLIEKLIEKLADGDPRTRRNAAGALRLHGSRAVGAIPALSSLLEDSDPAVRAEAERTIDRLRLMAA